MLTIKNSFKSIHQEGDAKKCHDEGMMFFPHFLKKRVQMYCKRNNGNSLNCSSLMTITTARETLTGGATLVITAVKVSPDVTGLIAFTEVSYSHVKCNYCKHFAETRS